MDEGALEHEAVVRGVVEGRQEVGAHRGLELVERGDRQPAGDGGPVAPGTLREVGDASPGVGRADGAPRVEASAT
ncbi:MAG: hypothetical protein M3P39_04695 [Actinomycetota bacterium]|nr:hypothetical protein [Actinomycetota bacterium]